jgi:putative transposase
MPMSNKGDCWDSAPMFSFFGTLKTECLHHYKFKTIVVVKQVTFEYIEVFYNRIRRHAKINNQITAQFAQSLT